MTEYAAFDFAKTGKKSEKERTLTAPGFFENYTDPSRVEDFNWPDPGIVVNNRWGRIGNYVTPACHFPEKRPDDWWEMCQCTNGHWGYKPGQPLPSAKWFLSLLAKCRAWGGNFLGQQRSGAGWHYA